MDNERKTGDNIYRIRGPRIAETKGRNNYQAVRESDVFPIKGLKGDTEQLDTGNPPEPEVEVYIGERGKTDVL